LRPYIKSFDQPQIKWLIPSAVDLPIILKAHPPSFSYDIDYFYYLLDVICDKMDYLDHSDYTKWVHLSGTRLQRIVHNYTKYLDYLAARNIIEINPSYKVGKHCKGYRITPKYYSGEPKEIEMDTTNLILKRKLNRSVRPEVCTPPNHTSVIGHGHLTKWFNQDLKIDTAAAIKKIDQLYGCNLPGVKKQTGRQGGRFKALRAVWKLSHQQFYYKVDSNIGRLHSNLTNIKKDLRKHMTYNDEKLVNLDIRNSQPLLSGVLLDKKFYSEKEKLSLLSFPSFNKLYNNNILNINKTISDILYSIMLVESPESLNSKEFEQYLSIVQGGTFYEEFGKALYPQGFKISRDKIKEAVFILFFADNRHGPKLRRKEAPFRAKFPTVYRIFSILKRHNKAVMSHILQRLESELIIEKITRRIAQERPQLPIFTIHDSIATTVGNEDYVQAVMTEEIKALTGLNASIGRENWYEQPMQEIGPVKALINAA
jgi:hypothetical protein